MTISLESPSLSSNFKNFICVLAITNKLRNFVETLILNEVENRLSFRVLNKKNFQVFPSSSHKCTKLKYFTLIASKLMKGTIDKIQKEVAAWDKNYYSKSNSKFISSSDRKIAINNFISGASIAKRFMGDLTYSLSYDMKYLVFAVVDEEHQLQSVATGRIENNDLNICHLLTAPWNLGLHYFKNHKIHVGAGTAVIETAVRFCRGNNLESIYLKSCSSAEEFYKKLSFDDICDNSMLELKDKNFIPFLFKHGGRAESTILLSPTTEKIRSVMLILRRLCAIHQS